MNLTKRQFFKRKNRKHIYGIYEDIVERAYNISDDYYSNLDRLQEFKEKYRTNTYIWDILSVLEYNITHSAYRCSGTRCQQIKSTPYKVTIQAYDMLNTDIEKLTYANGKMISIFTMLENMEKNDLTVRTK